MAAVIRPVGIQHADFGHRRISGCASVESACEIVLDPAEIRKGHRETKRIIKLPERIFRHCVEAFKNDDIRGLRIRLRKRLRLFRGSFSGIHRVNDICLDSFKFRIGYITRDDIRLCGMDNDTGIRV